MTQTTYKHPFARNPQLVELHNYQRQMANFAIEHPKCGLFLPMGSGKAIDDTAWIPTPTGLRQVSKIRVGSYLIGRNGKPTKVTAVYPHKDKEALKITLEDNRELICCTEHLISYIKNKELVTEDAQTIYKKIKNGETITLPEADPIIWAYRKTEIHPYALGVILGCGWLSTNMPKIRCTKKTAEKFCNAIKVSPKKLKQSNKFENLWSLQYDLYVKYFQRNLRSTGLAKIKKPLRDIPPEYIINSIENRTALFEGLIDGFEFDTQKINDTTIRITIPGPKLAKSFVMVARSLGYSAKYELIKETGKKSKHTIEIVKNGITGQKRTVNIKSIVPVEPRNMTCFTVDAPDHLFLANDFIVTHNTLTTLEVIYELAPRCKILIIGPRPVVRSTWNDEIKKWKFPLRVKSLIENDKGRALSREKRHELYQEVCQSKEAAIWLINREMVCDLVEHLPKMKNQNGQTVPYWPFKMVVIDEAQAFKTYNSKRFKALASVTDQIPRLIELTGTPTPNGLMDLWALIYLLDQGKRLGPNITAYRTSYFYSTMTTPNGAPIGWVPLTWASREIHKRVSDIVVSLPDIQQNMPDVVFSNHIIQLNPTERKMYKELIKEQVLEFDDGDEVVAANAAVLQSKLSQLASGAIYVNGTSEYKELHRRKIDECLRIVEEAGEPTLIAYHFRSDKEMIVKYMREVLDNNSKNKGKKKQKELPDNSTKSRVQVFDGSPEMVRRWNNKEIDVMLIQPASAGHGLNLQYGGSTLIWYTLPWNLEHYLQTNARLHRQGQKNTVFIHRLMTEKTVDEKIEKALNKKDLSEQALLDAVAATIHNLN